MRLDRRTFVAGGVAAAQGLTILPACAAPAGDRWLNAPPQWQATPGGLRMTTAPKTDFWRKTFFGYVTDNGHVYGRDVAGDFTAVVRLAGKFTAQYDQGGLMVRQDATTWMKCGVEFVDGRATISSVFTRDFSDWAGAPAQGADGPLWVRLVRKGGSLTYAWSSDGKTFREVRQGYLSEAPSLFVGMMAAAPEGPGFEVEFSDFAVSG